MGLVFTDFNRNYFKVRPATESDTEDYRRLFLAMKKYVEGYKYMPAYKYGEWDGTIEYLHYRTGKVKLGLLEKTLQLTKENGIEVDHIDENIYSNHFKGFPKVEVETWLKMQKVYSKGELLIPRDYQLESVKEALNNKRLLIQSPTSSGKSLIIYLTIKYLLEQIEGRVLLIVPTTNLVEQMFNDFCDYENGKITWAETSTDKKRTNDKPVFISTWQTAIRQKEPTFWASFQCLMVDEAHHCKATSLNKISDALENAEFRFGYSGSLKPNWKDTNYWTIASQFGAIHTTITTKSLIAQQQIAKAKVVLLELDHRGEEIPRLEYADELKYICTTEERNDIVVKIVENVKGNTLILFSLVEKHGKVLYDLLQKKFKDRKVLFVYGDVKAEEREEIRQYAENNENVIIVASYQTFSTGVNIKNLHNIIFAAPTKSFTRVVQSVGRGLRKSNTKNECTIFDLFDLLYGDPTKIRRTNYTYRHFLNRLEIYKKEGFPVKMLRQKIVKNKAKTIDKFL